MSILNEYGVLRNRIDSHSDRVLAAWEQHFACAEGCSGCCQRDLSVFAIEAHGIRAWLREHPPGLRAPSPTGVSSALPVLEEPAGPGCAMLDSVGRCGVYPVRPLICRSHGLPLAVPSEGGGLRGDVCPLNFDGGAALAELPSGDFLSVETVDTVLAALDLRFSEEQGLPPGERFRLEELWDEAAS